MVETPGLFRLEEIKPPDPDRPYLSVHGNGSTKWVSFAEILTEALGEFEPGVIYGLCKDLNGDIVKRPVASSPADGGGIDGGGPETTEFTGDGIDGGLIE